MTLSSSNTENLADPRDAVFETSDMLGDLGRRTGDASVLLLVMSALKTLQQFATIAIVARLVGPAEYGVFALAVPGVMLARALSNFGLPQAIVQRPDMTHGLATTLFWANIAFAALTAIALAGLAWPASWLFDDPRVIPVIHALSGVVLLSAAIGQYTAILRRRMRVGTIETITFLAEFGGIAVVVTAALAGLSYWSLVLQQVAVAVLTIVALVAAVGWSPSGPGRVRLGQARAALSFGGFVAGSALIGRVIQYMGTVITGAGMNEAAAGLFHRARTLSEMPRKRVTMPLSSAFVPSMSRLQHDHAAQRAMLARTLSRSALIMLPAAVLMAAAAEPLTLLLLGRQWADLAPLLAWLSLFSVRALVAMALFSILIGCGRSKELFFYNIARLAMVTVAMALTVGEGLIVMAAAYALTELLLTLPAMVFVASRYTSLKTGFLLKAIGADLVLAGSLAAALILGVAPRLETASPLLQVAVIVSITGAVYGVRVGVSAELRGEVRRMALRFAGRLTGLSKRRRP